MEGSKTMDISKKDIDAVIADVAALKRDLAKAIERFRSTSLDDAVEHVQDLAEQVGDNVTELYKDAAKRGQRGAKALSRKVEDQPLASLLIAFSAGFILSRILSR
jgi:ElaB/YqjD/DUF883 family membrane-anchored ribosome-binding protein